VKHIIFSIVFSALLTLGLGLPAQAQSPAVICLDAGHGGMDPGAVYWFADGTLLKEAEINLDVAVALKALLEQSGYQVSMTRTDSTFLTTRDRYPMANAAQADLFVSIHTNSIDAARAAEIDGACTLYMKDADIPFAEALEDVLYPAVLAHAPQPAIFLDRGARPFRSRLMTRTNMPAVIVEPVFLSHPEEAARLVSPIQYDSAGQVLANTRRAEIAYALHKGILNYLASPAQTASASDQPAPANATPAASLRMAPERQ
jgi:N-acetylmuramoyl-L-alanine amidase